MRVQLAYGRHGIDVDLPDGRCDVIRPNHQTPLADPLAALGRALDAPVGCKAVRELVRPGQRVVISVCDGTRPQPRALMLAALLDRIDGIVAPEDVTVLVATGTHRGNTGAELRAMLGSRIVDHCQVLNHDARDESSLAFLGDTDDGVPVWVNRIWVEAEVRITTGFVEPHFFAGFSGGPKMVTPGLAGLATVMRLHDARRIGDPRATWGVCVGNPVHDSIRSAAALAPPAIACDVLLDGNQQITAVFAGELFDMHRRARRAARAVAMRPVPAAYDVVVTSNAGFPLDQNLYQAVKGMAAAERVVRVGGSIILAAECVQGVPDGSPYADLLSRSADLRGLAEVLDDPELAAPDQWQVMVQARIQRRARVRVHCSGVDDDRLAAAHLRPAPDIRAAVDEALAESPADARVCVLPEGPQTIPYLATA